jgi:hypothetical protein
MEVLTPHALDPTSFKISGAVRLAARTVVAPPVSVSWPFLYHNVSENKETEPDVLHSSETWCSLELLTSAKTLAALSRFTAVCITYAYSTQHRVRHNCVDTVRRTQKEHMTLKSYLSAELRASKESK